MAARRSQVNDGFGNRLEFYITTHFGQIWRILQSIDPVRRHLNAALINRAILRMPTRPNPLSTMVPYTSWRSLTDRTFDARHLPPAPELQGGLPSVEQAAELFMRRSETILCPKSTVLFSYFAQWFTDGFLRSDRSEPRDPRKNDSTHELDLSQLYGVNNRITDALRTFEDGLLKSQLINGEEFPHHLCKGGQVKPEFQDLSVVRFNQLTDEQKDGLFAMGSDTANFQIGFAMMNVLFLREHNRIAHALKTEYPGWDDERLFGTARNILTVLVIKIVIEEYINHIAPYYFKFLADPQPFRNEPWYRQNWMAIEFNLLYRWHGLVPSTVRIDGQDLPITETLFNNELLTRYGLGLLFEEASNQRAGRIGLLNTDPFLWEAEVQSVRRGRAVELASYNDYRVLCKFPRVTEFDQISGDPQIQARLRELYGRVDRIELYVGLFAEDLRLNSALPPLIGRMVATDAFSQALTNPLLAPRIFNERTFSELGMELIRTTQTLSQVLHRNIPDPSKQYFVSLTRRDWKRV